MKHGGIIIGINDALKTDILAPICPPKVPGRRSHLGLPTA